MKDIADHSMEVRRDDGLYRHLVFSRGGSSVYRFDLITWPGHLCICGDMGSDVFLRLQDMFEFFRTDRKYAEPGELAINLGYWSEKLVAVSGERCHGGAKRYSEEKFERVVKEQLVTWFRERTLTAEGRRELREAVEEDVLSAADDGEFAAHQAARGFQHGNFRFSDFWEHDLTEYTNSFIWRCYAIAWGIQQYDALSKKEAA